MNVCIAIDKAEKQLIAAVNAVLKDYGLSCTLLEPIVGKIYRAVQDGKQKELAAAMEKEANEDGTERPR